MHSAKRNFEPVCCSATWIAFLLSLQALVGNGGSQLSQSSDIEWVLKLGNSVGNQHTLLASDVGRNSQPERSTNGEQSIPGSRAGSASWSDREGNMWLFGGEGFDKEPTNEAHLLNDLWMFNSTVQRWQLINIADAKNNQRNDSLQRQVPRPRKGAVACGVEGIIFMVFGGEGVGKTKLYDTWIFNIPSKTWLPLYIHFPLEKTKPHHPSGRTGAVSWCHGDKLVIYGGLGSDGKMSSDMWQFSLRDLQWSELHAFGSTYPVPRCGASAWSSLEGKLFMFGGNKDPDTVINSYRIHQNDGFLNDFWKFDLKNQIWAQLTFGHIPSPRAFSSHWGDTNGNLWFSHGIGKDKGTPNSDSSELQEDTWMFDTSRQIWINIQSEESIEFLLNTTSKVIPSARYLSPMWRYQNVTYMFGGFGYDGRHKVSFLNDLWVLLTDKSHALQNTTQANKDTFIERFTPGLVFLITMGSTASVACVFGMVFCMKKTLEYPSRAPTTAYNVRYVPLSKDEANLEFS